MVEKIPDKLFVILFAVMLFQLNACTDKKDYGLREKSPGLAAEASPHLGTAPLTVAFNAGSLLMPRADDSSFTWNFDDGQSSGGKTATHTFTTPGTYMVTLAAAGSSGRKYTTWVVIIVK
jgi:PKD repeat protein